MPLVLFDDRVARAWYPFTTTRPAGELLFGISTLRSRAEHAYDLECIGHLTADALANYDEPWAPPTLSPADLAAVRTGRAAHAEDADVIAIDRDPDRPRGLVLLSSRFVAEPGRLPAEPSLLVCDGQVVGCTLDADTPLPGHDFFLAPDAAPPDLPRHDVAGQVLGGVWELMEGNADRVDMDLSEADHAALPGDVHHLGRGPVSVGEDVDIGPGVVLDTRWGPIRLDDGVTVAPFTRVVGPAYVGPGSALLGGPFAAVTIGPVCKVHGEVESTVILGYSNKAHDGFLGHAYLGMWVNLGAMTTNSDLKNNYGTVRVWTPDGEVDTGSRKIGCFLGDHVKTAIGTLLNTGTVVGAGSNVFPTAGEGGSAFPPKHLPPFSWGDPGIPYALDRFLATAETVMDRRRVELSDAQRQLLTRAWETARG